MKCIFSVDVEDWFHILDLPSTPDIAEWNSLPSRVERNFMRLLDMFSNKRVRVTCFFLGWVAERFPGLVLEAKSRGHEIASHGYSHRLVYEMTEEEFYQDAKRSKDVLEEISGGPVYGFRSSGFSVTERTPWFFDMLIKAGYLYDSSVFPARRGHGGMEYDNLAPHYAGGASAKIIEFPITVARVLNGPRCFFGGGYMRISPYFIIKRMARRVLGENRPVIFYVHPREIDAESPRLPMPLMRKFKSYVNIRNNEKKIGKILEQFEFVTFEEFIGENFSPAERRGDA